MNVELYNMMGSDMTVVDAARVSFNKESDWDWSNGEPELSKADEKLISYLAKHNHWTPFSHPQVTLRIKAPIFVARQLFKHKIGLVENEISRRYVDDPPEFFFPDEWRGRPENGMKQGSSEKNITSLKPINLFGNNDIDVLYEDFINIAENLYERMIESGVAPEQARMILPQSMYTEFFWTGSLAAFARVCKQRLDPHAQEETRKIAERIDEIISPLFPCSWQALVKGE